MNFTPGPWGISFNGRCTWTIEEIGGDHRYVTSVGRQQDAHLIAAAPDLFAVCIDAYSHLHGRNLSPLEKLTHDKLQSAIKKAGVMV